MHVYHLEAEIAAAGGKKVPTAVVSPPILKIKAILEAALPQVKALPSADPKVILPQSFPRTPLSTLSQEFGGSCY